jgi:hypothetical protein
MGWRAHECYVSAEAFRALADLAGLLPRDIVRRLPDPGLKKVAARTTSRSVVPPTTITNDDAATSFSINDVSLDS